MYTNPHIHASLCLLSCFRGCQCKAGFYVLMMHFPFGVIVFFCFPILQNHDNPLSSNQAIGHFRDAGSRKDSDQAQKRMKTYKWFIRLFNGPSLASRFLIIYIIPCGYCTSSPIYLCLIALFKVIILKLKKPWKHNYLWRCWAFCCSVVGISSSSISLVWLLVIIIQCYWAFVGNFMIKRFGYLGLDKLWKAKYFYDIFETHFF